VTARFGFEVLSENAGARRGRLTLAHGVVETPAFMPVGTQGAVKGVTLDQVQALGAEIILGNTYHLHLRPTDALIARAGGLHAFMGWSRPILTDSGGFQVFSLAGRRTVSEERVVFQSHLDGSECWLSPESAADVQARLGSDIAMVFDECVKWPVTHDEAAAAMQRTLRWAQRGRARFEALSSGIAKDVTPSTPGQAQFGIIQGATFKDLRDESVAGHGRHWFRGLRNRGVIGRGADRGLYDLAGHTAAQLPSAAPRYLMGVGMPDDLVHCVARGIDMFDCVLPTRNARNGQLFTRHGPISIKNAKFAEDSRPPDPDCSCPTCRTHSRAYLRHLYMAGEMSAAALNTVHNLHFYLDTMRGIRKAIEFGRFDDFKQGFLDAYTRPQPD
jgi:queuine tRNA-ribosyltransferase